jgi:hypothetical protein
MHLRGLRSATQELVEEDIQALGNVHREPDLPAGGTDLDGHLQHDRRSTIALSHAGTPRRLALTVVASLAMHQRLLR